MKPKRKTIVIITILAILVSIGELLRPYIIKVVIDDYLSLGIFQKGMITIGMLGAMYIGLVFITNILEFIARATTKMMGEDIIYQLRNKLYKFIQNANIPFHDKTPAGKLFVRITNDVEDIATLFKDVFSTFFRDVIMVIALIGVMLYISTKLSLLTFIIIPIIILVSFCITKLINRIYTESKNIRTQLNSFLAESIYGVKIIRIFNRQYEKQKECEAYNTKFWRGRIPSGIWEGFLYGFMTVIQNIGISIVVWACIEHWLGVTLEVGVIYMFISYIKQIFEPINNIIDNIETVQESLVSIDKIYEILDQKDCLEEFEKGTTLETIQGKIEFKNVWFAYEKDNWILKDVSFTILPGQSVALVGKTGSGKTTITNLINRFYEIQKGEILLDGVNIKELNLRFLRKAVGIVLQDPFIFAKSIKDNICLNASLEEQEVLQAVRLSSAEEFVSSFPNGIEEVSYERGNSYSAGEKQLLAFARIFAHDPAIFILDEATANIDTYTEQLIQKSVDEISKNKTSIFIAHRLSTIVNVDKIIVLDHGRIQEQGSHQELLQTGGYYSKLYQAYYSSLTAS